MEIRGTARNFASVQTGLTTASSIPAAAVASGNDKIRVTTLGKTFVSVMINHISFGTFPLSAFDQIVVDALDGDDDVTIDSSITKEAILFGAAGNDLLRAGGGNSVIVGGDGVDALFGGSGRNVLIGGRGLDLLYGGKADDLLIAGWTNYDDDLAKLLAISTTWNTGSYSERVNKLSATTSAVSLNLSTVHDDSETDTLLGDPLLSRERGRDWFFANFTPFGKGLDLVLDKASNERADDL
jgi:Ca2+-binding RTX toxin-like protein